MAIGNLLLLDMRRTLENKKIYNCPFSIQKNQHPLITVLSQDREIWLDVYNQIQMFMQHFDDKYVVMNEFVKLIINKKNFQNFN